MQGKNNSQANSDL